MWLRALGYHNFRLEQQIIILGDNEQDNLFNLIVLLEKQLIYQNKKTESILLNI